MRARLLVVAAAVVAGAASARTPVRGSTCSEGLVRDPAYANIRCVPAWTLDQPQAPAPAAVRRERTDTVAEVAPVAGLTITVVAAGAAGWNVTIVNGRDSSVSVVWDESSYVTPKGKVAGRLIRGKTRMIDTGKTQPPSPIPPGATLEEWCIHEAGAEILDYNEKNDVDLVLTSDAGPDATGRLYLVLISAGERLTWEGGVAFRIADGARAPGSGRE